MPVLRTIYDVSALAALSVASWGLTQVSQGVGAVRRYLPESRPGPSRRNSPARAPVRKAKRTSGQKKTRKRQSRSGQVHPLDL